MLTEEQVLAAGFELENDYSNRTYYSKALTDDYVMVRLDKRIQRFTYMDNVIIYDKEHLQKLIDFVSYTPA